MLSFFSRFFPISILQKWAKQPLFLPFYHIIDNGGCPHIRHLYELRRVADFEADIDFFLKHFKPVTLQEILDSQAGKKPLPKNAFHVSFDDGLRQCFSIIRPILLRKGVPATFFINSDFIDNQQLMFRYKASLLIEAYQSSNSKIQHSIVKKFGLPNAQFDTFKTAMLDVHWAEQEVLDAIAPPLNVSFADFLQHYQPYLSTHQLAQLQNDGFSLGSHSQNHPLYAELNLEQQLAQTIDCQQILNEKFELPYRVFAFPFTDSGVKDEFWQQLQQRAPFDLTFACAGVKLDRQAAHLQRFAMETTGHLTAAQNIRTEYLYTCLRQLVNKHFVER